LVGREGTPKEHETLGAKEFDIKILSKTLRAGLLFHRATGGGKKRIVEKNKKKKKKKIARRKKKTDRAEAISWGKEKLERKRV